MAGTKSADLSLQTTPCKEDEKKKSSIDCENLLLAKNCFLQLLLFHCFLTLKIYIFAYILTFLMNTYY
jgi:hypothetical protein